MEKEKLRNIRLFLNMSQSAFAKHIGVAESTISMIEAGNRGVSDTVASRVAKKFEVTEDFVEFMENRKKLID